MMVCSLCGATCTSTHECGVNPESVDATTNLVPYTAVLVHVGIDPLRRAPAAVAELHRAHPDRSYAWCKEIVDEMSTRRLYRHMALHNVGPGRTAEHCRVPADHPALLVAALRLDLNLGDVET